VRGGAAGLDLQAACTPVPVQHVLQHGVNGTVLYNLYKQTKGMLQLPHVSPQGLHQSLSCRFLFSRTGCICWRGAPVLPLAVELVLVRGRRERAQQALAVELCNAADSQLPNRRNVPGQ
jgi:hypothetical protein